MTGCSASPEGEASPVLKAPEWLPEGLSLRVGCVWVDGDQAGAAILGYRGDGRYKSEVEPIRVESAYLRVFGWDFDVPLDLDEPPQTVEELVAESMSEAEPSSIQPVVVNGINGELFLMRSGEEPSSWPAVLWMEGPRLHWVLGEGLDEAAVLRVANSLQDLSLSEFREVVEDEEC